MSKSNAGTATEGKGSCRRHSGIKSTMLVRRARKETEEETDCIQREGA